MKKNLKIFLGIIIFIISFILIDGLCAIYMDTRPIFAYKEDVFRIVGKDDSVFLGVVYKSLFADVYYCNTVIESYDEDGKSNIEEKVLRYYKNKGEEFTCDTYIDERSEMYEPYRDEAEEHRDMLYMRYDAEGKYMAKFNVESYNKKLNIFTHSYLGDYYVSEKYQDIYMFDVEDFSKEPIKLELDGFDLLWRTKGYIRYSPTGNIMVFEYFCGYRPEQWMGEQKYTEEDCKKNSNDNGIYVFKVNGINDYTLLGYYSDKRNEYVSEYQDSYFQVYDVIDDENIIIKYTVTHNKHVEPEMVLYYKWNFDSDTLTEWQV